MPLEHQQSPINWPDEYRPAVTPIHAANSATTIGSIESVWALLVHAPEWSSYYPHATNVTIDGGGGDALSLGATFFWETAGVRLRSVVRQFEPNQKIAWEAFLADDDDSKAYHAWVLTPTQDGCTIHTEETQTGSFWEDLAKEKPGTLWNVHQEWVEALAKASTHR